MQSSCPSPANICLVVVTYYPDSGFRDRIAAISSQVGQAIVVNNSASDEASDVFREIRSDVNEGIEIITTCENVGQAAGLNIGFAAAANLGFEWALCLDQDSTPSADLVSILIEAYQAYDGRRPVGIVASGYGSGPIPSVEPPFGANVFAEVLTAITSGSLIRIAAFNAAGGFREDFFIDSVDHEFCLRLIDLGYTILLTRKEGLRHIVGKPSRPRFLWKTPYTSNHSAIRRYYMSRNRLIVFHEYANKHPAWVKYMKERHWHEVVVWCLVEEDRLRKIYATLLGTFHGWRRITGKLHSRVLREF